MNALVRKEIRLLLPTWVISLALAIIPFWWAASAPFCCTLGALLVSLALYGQEFGAGTFQQFLAQPIAREKLWWTKAGVLSVSVLSVVVTGLLASFSGRHGNFFPHDVISFAASTICMVVAAFAGGLWTTILLRQVAAALWLTVLIPLVISGTTMVAVQKTLHTPEESRVPEFWALGTLVLYSIAGFYWARRMFLAAQDTQWTGGTVTLPLWVVSKSRNLAVGTAPKRKPFRALIWKEIQLQQVSLIFATIILVVHLLEIGLQKLLFDPSQKNHLVWQALGLCWTLWFALPFVIGSTAVSEERKYATLETQHCLPVTRLVQFSLKFALVMVLGIFLGGFMPWLVQTFGGLIGTPGEFPRPQDPDFLTPLKGFFVVAFAITFISFYASTLTRNILQAMGTAVLVAVSLGPFHGWSMTGGMIGKHHLWLGNLPFFIGIPTLIVVLILLGIRNYQSLLVNSKIWARNALLVLAALLFTVSTSALLYNRVWELVMALEPNHGPAQLSGVIQPQVFSVGRGISTMSSGKPLESSKIFALLPDGRLWTPTNNRLVDSGFKMEVGQSTHSNRKTPLLEELYVSAPVAGVFIGETNWVQLAADYNTLMGIQVDGSLWKIFQANWVFITNQPVIPIPKQIGMDTNWKSVVAGEAHFLALKTDGTLWEWGILIQGSSRMTVPSPTRVGTDSDWVKVFASRNSSVAIKRDGSVWRWGQMFLGGGYNESSKITTEKHPLRWNVTGMDWREYLSVFDWCLVIKEDGSLWASGKVPPNIFSQFSYKAPWGYPYSEGLLQVRDAGDWSQIGVDSQGLIALKRSGSILQYALWNHVSSAWGGVRKRSKNSDWLAIGTTPFGQSLALAADGTLCLWQAEQRFGGENQPLLGPSRKPVWTANILSKN